MQPTHQVASVQVDFCQSQMEPVAGTGFFLVDKHLCNVEIPMQKNTHLEFSRLGCDATDSPERSTSSACSCLPCVKLHQRDSHGRASFTTSHGMQRALKPISTLQERIA